MALNLCVTAIFQFRIYYLINHICMDYIYSPYKYLYNLIEKMKIPNPYQKNPLKNFMHINYRFICKTISYLIFHPMYIYRFSTRKRKILKVHFIRSTTEQIGIFSWDRKVQLVIKHPQASNLKRELLFGFPLNTQSMDIFSNPLLFIDVSFFFVFLLSVKEGWLIYILQPPTLFDTQ